MNENLNLIEILKNVPKGTMLWSPIYGDVKLANVYTEDDVVYPIEVGTKYEDISFTKDGRYNSTYPGECMLFPSEDQRDWSKLEVPKQKVKYTLRPFDRILIRDDDSDNWTTDHFSYYGDNESEPYVCRYCSWEQCIPYNEQTAHLLGTTDPCPIDYEFEFNKDYVPEK